MLKAVEKKRAYEDIVEQIRTLIENGKLKINDQLPNERELAETFKVSRATVREAMRTLESMRLVQSRQGEGTYVLASSEEALIQPLASALFREKDDLFDIFFIRQIIEPYIAQMAAENATLKELNELEAILKQQKEDFDENQTVEGTDIGFHSLLAKMAKRPVIERLLLALVDLLAQTRQQSLQNKIRAEQSMKGHREIFLEVRNGNCSGARKAMLRHLQDVESLLFPKKGGARRKRSRKMHAGCSENDQSD